MVHWLYIDFNSFFASCEQQENPALRNRPVAVVPMMADSTSCLAASYEAKAFGVKTGVKVRDAKKMCPGIQFVVSNHRTYVQYHHRAIEIIESCVPVHSVCSIDEICCELTGSQKELAKARDLALLIKARLREQLGECLTSSIGLGPNTLLSKIAADMQKPDGLTSIETEELPNKLYSLQLRDIPGIGPRMEYRLRQKGIHEMKDLLRQSESQMRGIWGGVLGVRYQRWLKGECFSSVRGAQKSIGHEHVLPPKLRSFKEAGLILQKLMVKAAVRLRRGSWMARRLLISVKFINGTSWEKELKFHETHDTRFFIQTLNSLYSECPSQFRPIKVRVTLSDFVSEKEHQLSFFENPARDSIHKVVDLINEKFGKDTLYLASLHGVQKSGRTAIAFSRIPELDEVENYKD